MSRVFVLEGRRLFPLLFLLMLLVSLSIYDNLRHQTEVPVFGGEEGEIRYEVVDRGKMEDRLQIRVLYEADDLVRVADEFSLELPAYPFQPAQQIGVLVVNGKFKKAELVPLKENLQVKVVLEKARNTYDLVMLDNAELREEEWYWVFADKKGNVFSQMPGSEMMSAEEEAVEGETEVVK